jgi:hypothetical protein
MCVHAAMPKLQARYTMQYERHVLLWGMGIRKGRRQLNYCEVYRPHSDFSQSSSLPKIGMILKPSRVKCFHN